MRYPPLLIARFIAMLLKPFAEGTGATIRGSLFLTLVFATLIYALRYTRTLAFCLTVLGVATVALRFLADQQRLPTLAFLSQGLSFIAMVVAMVAMFSEVLRARSASSDLVMGAVCFVPHYRHGLDVSLLFNLPAFARLKFSYHRAPRFGPLLGTEAKFPQVLQLRSANHDRVKR